MKIPVSAAERKHTAAFIINSDAEIVASDQKDRVGTRLDLPDLQTVFSSAKGHYVTRVGNQHKCVAYAKAQVLNLQHGLVFDHHAAVLIPSEQHTCITDNARSIAGYISRGRVGNLLIRDILTKLLQRQAIRVPRESWPHILIDSSSQTLSSPAGSFFSSIASASESRRRFSSSSAK